LTRGEAGAGNLTLSDIEFFSACERDSHHAWEPIDGREKNGWELGRGPSHLPIVGT
jgi:hypothetical protein